MPDTNHWLVVMTKSQQEAIAKQHLQHQEFTVYLPHWLALKRRQGRWKKVQSPMFPRYLFIQTAAPEQSLAPIRSTRGVSQLVRFGLEPAVASAQLIDNIKQIEQARLQMTSQLTPFKKGDQVQIVSGPFKGIAAEVFACDKQRVIVLLQVLGKTQTLSFDNHHCQNF